jgi:hypothetical protein
MAARARGQLPLLRAINDEALVDDRHQEWVAAGRLWQA